MWYHFVQSWKCMSLKFTGELLDMAMKNDAKIEEEFTCQFKTDMRNMTNFDPKISKFYSLMGYFWSKYILFDLKKYRRVIFDGTKDWCKIWKKTNLCFQKWHEAFRKFSPEHSEVSKLGLCWYAFIESRKCLSLKFTGQLCVMIMKNDAKI